MVGVLGLFLIQLPPSLRLCLSYHLSWRPYRPSYSLRFSSPPKAFASWSSEAHSVSLLPLQSKLPLFLSSTKSKIFFLLFSPSKRGLVSYPPTTFWSTSTCPPALCLGPERWSLAPLPESPSKCVRFARISGLPKAIP